MKKLFFWIVCISSILANSFTTDEVIAAKNRIGERIAHIIAKNEAKVTEEKQQEESEQEEENIADDIAKAEEKNIEKSADKEDKIEERTETNSNKNVIATEKQNNTEVEEKTQSNTTEQNTKTEVQQENQKEDKQEQKQEIEQEVQQEEKSIYDFEFDVDKIKTELIAVGESMGMTHIVYDEGVQRTPSNTSWSNPITASSSFQGSKLERALKDYVRSMPTIVQSYGGNEIKYFTIYVQSNGNGSYTFYFLY